MDKYESDPRTHRGFCTNLCLNKLSIATGIDSQSLFDSLLLVLKLRTTHLRLS